MRGWPVLEFSHYYLCWPTSSPPCRGMPPVAGGRQERHTSVRLKPYQEEQNRKSRPFCGILMWFCCTPSIEPWRGWGDMAEGSWMKNCCGDESMQGVSSAVVSCPENPFIIFTSVCHSLLWQWERLVMMTRRIDEVWLGGGWSNQMWTVKLEGEEEKYHQCTEGYDDILSIFTSDAFWVIFEEYTWSIHRYYF